MKFRTVMACAVAAAISPMALADFQYQQTTKITGGAMLNMMKMMGRFSKTMRQGLEPITSNVAIKGNRMITSNNERTEIIDLDKETFTYIDHAKKEYSVATFQQVRDAMEQAAREAEQKMAEAKQKQAPAEPQTADVSFSANVRDGNKTRQIEGLNTKLSILTLTMNAKDKKTGEQGAMGVTSDMWLAPEIAGYKEVRDFHMRLAQKLGFAAGGAMNSLAAAMQKSMMKGMSDLQKEASKLNGIPVYQVTRMGATADGQPLPPASEAPLPPTPEMQMPSAGEIGTKVADRAAENAANTAGANAEGAVAQKLGRFGGLAGGLGSGIGGFGRKKKQQDEQAQAQKEQQQRQAAQQQAQGPAVLMEMESSLSGFSSGPVDTAQFSVPAGYKQVAPDIEKRGRK